jgi:threonine synthase
MNYLCFNCQSTYLQESKIWTCPCGGLLHLDYEKGKVDFSKTARSRDTSLWKYVDALPFEQEDRWQDVTLGEGGTPLINISDKTFAKAEYYMPTLSFKDRGAVVLIAMLKKLGINRIVVDSSGNAGTSIAAYSARAGIQADVFVPASTSSNKMKQIEAHGAVIHQVPGTREDTAQAAKDFVEETNAFYASHIYNPLFWEGTKTYVYEIFEQMNGHLPEALIVPVGHGTLFMGTYIALKELKFHNQIEEMPRLLAVQAKSCAPIAEAFAKGRDAVQPVKSAGTVAEGIATAAPPRGTEILKAIKDTHGDVIGVTEESILRARKELASMGIYVETTAAANYSGYLKYVEKYPELKERHVVFPLCGAGIKSD